MSVIALGSNCCCNGTSFLCCVKLYACMVHKATTLAHVMFSNVTFTHAIDCKMHHYLMLGDCLWDDLIARRRESVVECEHSSDWASNCCEASLQNASIANAQTLYNNHCCSKTIKMSAWWVTIFMKRLVIFTTGSKAMNEIPVGWFANTYKYVHMVWIPWNRAPHWLAHCLNCRTDVS